MFIRNLVTVFLTAISLLFTFQVSKSLTNYIFDKIFVPATNFETCSFDTNDFEPFTGFDLFEDFLNAFESVHSEPVETTPNASNLLGDLPSYCSDFVPPPSSSDAPGESPSPSTDSPPPPPPASEKSTTGQSGSTHGIRVVSTTLIITALVARSCRFKRRPLPPPPPPPPPPQPPPPLPRPPPSPSSPPSPLPPSPPPQRFPTPPPPVKSPPIPSAIPSPAPAVMDRLTLVAAPARQVAGARRKSRRAKKKG